MKSMTGYAKGIAEQNDRKVTIEMKAVNHRYLDLLFKLPRGFNFLEDTLRKEIQKEISRGHIDIYCNYEDNREGQSIIKVDTSIAKQYQKIGVLLEDIGFMNDMTASQVLKMPEVLTTKGAEDDEEEIKKLAIEATKDAVKALCEMRAIEGNALKRDILQKLERIVELIAEITQKAPTVVEEYRTKLRNRIEEATELANFDEGKLISEVAYFADKASIDEELTRLACHIEQGRKSLEESGAAGRKLDFLVQEMNRETNTIGSKSNDIYITQRVLELKGEIEKIREQVQNIE